MFMGVRGWKTYRLLLGVCYVVLWGPSDSGRFLGSWTLHLYRKVAVMQGMVIFYIAIFIIVIVCGRAK